MADLLKLVQDVITMTSRPELAQQIMLEVQNATLKAHNVDFWLRDKFEKTVNFNLSGTAFALDIPTQLERFRKFSYIKPYDVASGLPITLGSKENLEEISPDKIFTEMRALKTDCFYMAGNTINIRTSISCSAFLCSWYKYPDVTLSGYNSWIAEMMPFIIVEEAIGKILTKTGSVEEGNKYLSKIMEINGVPGENLKLLRVNEIEATAR